MLQARFLRALSLLLVLQGFPLHVPAQEKAPALPVVTIKAGAAVIHAEVARSTEEKALGLMHRSRLADNDGMIFIMEGNRHAEFWMKDTPLPLSIAFINAEGVILEIADMQPFDEKVIESASDRVAFALEMNQHWFTLNRVKPGDQLALTGKTWAAFFAGK